jgi:hypothetical protein
MDSTAINLSLHRADGGYVPGEPITGRVAWDIADRCEKVIVRLFWRTEGKGTQDVGVAAEQVFDHVSPRETRDFRFDGVASPYSFSGNLVSIIWAVEAIAEPVHEVARAEFVLSPTGQEVRPA